MSSTLKGCKGAALVFLPFQVGIGLLTWPLYLLDFVPIPVGMETSQATRPRVGKATYWMSLSYEFDNLLSLCHMTTTTIDDHAFIRALDS